TPICAAIRLLGTPSRARCLIMSLVSCRIIRWSPPARWGRSCSNAPNLHAAGALLIHLLRVVASAATPLRPDSPAYRSVKFSTDDDSPPRATSAVPSRPTPPWWRPSGERRPHEGGPRCHHGALHRARPHPCGRVPGRAGRGGQSREPLAARLLPPRAGARDRTQ